MSGGDCWMALKVLLWSFFVYFVVQRLTGDAMADAQDPRWAWQPYTPSDKSPWDLKKVGHLYRRAAFGATAGELDAALADGPQKTIDRLLDGSPGIEAFERETAERVPSIAHGNNNLQARAWWLYRMLYTP